MSVLLKAGEVSLRSWRAIYRGAAVALDRGSDAAILEGARAVDRLVARGAPI
jgi:histidine ammonia-lyase